MRKKEILTCDCVKYFCAFKWSILHHHSLVRFFIPLPLRSISSAVPLALIVDRFLNDDFVDKKKTRAVQNLCHMFSGFLSGDESFSV